VQVRVLLPALSAKPMALCVIVDIRAHHAVEALEAMRPHGKRDIVGSIPTDSSMGEIYAITRGCIGVKAAACLDACAFDAIHPQRGEPGFSEIDRLYIDPVACVGCMACESACPVGAALPVGNVSKEEVEENAAYYNR
jgi:ferredoxin